MDDATRSRVRRLALLQGLAADDADAWLRLVEDAAQGDGGRTFLADLRTEESTAILPEGAARYVELGLLGAGGMGEVHRVRDRLLSREVAMKSVLPGSAQRTGPEVRFVREARITAKLQHPGVVPVHDMGWHEDGRPWFTMPVVEGVTLDTICARLARSEPDWPLRRVLELVYRVAQTVAYAHAHGVVHRDLKPGNVMVGRFGEVLVVDWGLATDEPVPTGLGARLAARGRQPAGTPAYMAPEQAQGVPAGPEADVYALGAVLYHVLAGRPPFLGDRDSVLEQLRSGAPDPLITAEQVPRAPVRVVEPPDADAELLAIVDRAMHREPAERFTAAALAAGLRAWLDGAKARARALELVASARDEAARAAHLVARARVREAEAAAALEAVPGWAPEDEKAAAWALEDAAAEERRSAARADLNAEAVLHAALRITSELPEAHLALARRYRAEHAAAERSRDADRTLVAEARLRRHVSELGAHAGRAELDAYLEGAGALTLDAELPGATAGLVRFTLYGRRLIEEPVRELGALPLRAVELPMGSWLLVVRHPDRPVVRVPVFVGRQEHWDGGVLRLPSADELGPDGCFVPAGPFVAGGDPEAVDPVPWQRPWVHDFALARFPVTNRSYIAFLEDLVASGRTDEALRVAPRERQGTSGGVGPLIYAFDGARFSLQPDADGDLWLPDWPVVMVDGFGARAYARWHARRTGQPWRLPCELEWEKAARGVDGRFYPWGDVLDPSWCNSRRSHKGVMQPSDVDAFPLDCSVYGVRGLAGNTRDTCADRYDPQGPPVVDGRAVIAPVADPAPKELFAERGGTWLGDVRRARAASRLGSPATLRYALLGFRLARSLASG